MKTMLLEIDDSLYGRLMAFIDQLPVGQARGGAGREGKRIIGLASRGSGGLCPFQGRRTL